MKKKISAVLLMVSMILGMAVQVPAMSASAKDEADPVVEVPAAEEAAETGAVHAYDPIAELEAEKRYRDSTNYVEGRIIFSVLDERSDGEAPDYLTIRSKLCKMYELTKVSMVYETVCKSTQSEEPPEGL